MPSYVAMQCPNRTATSLTTVRCPKTWCTSQGVSYEHYRSLHEAVGEHYSVATETEPLQRDKAFRLSGGLGGQAIEEKTRAQTSFRIPAMLISTESLYCTGIGDTGVQ